MQILTLPCEGAPNCNDMYWDRIIGQKRVIDLLKSAVDTGRVAHAYLFHGMDGTGKRAAAFAFAHALQCNGCDKTPPCSLCIQAQELQHPDIHILMPQPSDVKPQDVQRRINLLAQDPYAAVDFVRAPDLESSKSSAKPLKQSFYSVDRINLDLRSKMILRPSVGHHLIAIITDIDAIHERAANGFLKLLEEPGPDTIFILTTSRKELLLPTILSRCQHVGFENLSAEEIKTALINRSGVAPNIADLVSQMSQGSYMRALQLGQNEELKHHRKQILTFLRLSFSGKFDEQTSLIGEISRSSRDGVKNMLRLLLNWIRDVALYKTLGDKAPLTNIDQTMEISKFCQNLQSADLDAMSQLTEEALELTESNVNTTLLLINLSFCLGKAMRSSYPIRLYTPLTTRSYV